MTPSQIPAHDFDAVVVHLDGGAKTRGSSRDRLFHGTYSSRARPLVRRAADRAFAPASGARFRPSSCLRTRPLRQDGLTPHLTPHPLARRRSYGAKARRSKETGPPAMPGGRSLERANRLELSTLTLAT